MMMMRRIGIFMFCVAAANLLQAQSVHEVQQKFPGDHAVILNQNRETKLFMKDGQPVAESREAVDILVLDDKANGIYNKYQIYHGFFDEMKDMEAYTRVPEGTKYRKIKVTDVKTQQARSSGIFYDDSKETSFSFPSMVEGAIASVSHTEFHKDAHLLTPFYFTSYMPVVNASFTVTVPNDIVLKYILKNNENNNIQVKESKKGKQTVYEFTSSNQKYKDRYGNSPSRSFHEPHVIIHVASYVNDKGETVSFLNSVDDLYKWNAGFLKDINTQTSPLLKHLADSLTAGITSEREKARNIYQWVQEHIKYVAFEAGLEGFVPRQAADVCVKRYGDCKDMSSLLTELLKLAGLKGYFTWIGTRSIPYDYTDVPLPITDNHMISTVNIGNEWIFLDGTDPNCIFGVPPKAIQGKQALISITPDEYKLLRVPEIAMSRNSVVDTTNISITAKGIKGSTSAHFNGYFGADAMNSLLYSDTKEVKDFVKGKLSKGSNKYIMDDYQVNKLDLNQKVVNMKASFEVPDYSKQIGDEMYINMQLERYDNTRLLDSAKRRVAVDNEFRYHVKNYTVLQVPDGYAISSLPANHEFKNDLYGFSIKYKEQSGQVVSTFEFLSDCMLLEPKDFGKWNDVMKELAVQSKKQLVLKKK